MEELKIEVTKGASGVRVFRLLGPLTLSSLFEFQDLVRAENDSPTVIDLAEVPYMDSAGLGALLGVYASCQRNGRGFAIAGSQDRIRTLFRVTHVDGLVPSFESVEKAEEQLSKKGGA
jgi:anti-sigma B factor antagonist